MDLGMQDDQNGRKITVLTSTDTTRLTHFIISKKKSKQ
jgi:hypothetical protein